jgi:type IV pilus assembly protein PilV
MFLRNKSFKPASAARGAGLIEVLVAVLVMAIGLLGIAAMQATALRNSQSAHERSQVVVWTYSIIDAMRANRDAALAGAYDIGMTCAAGGGGSLAGNDIAAWITAMQAELGDDACGSIVRNGGDVEVTIRWNDSRGQGGDEAQTLVTETRL